MTSRRINIGLPGAAGRMGGMLIREIAQADDLHLQNLDTTQELFCI